MARASGRSLHRVIDAQEREIERLQDRVESLRLAGCELRDGVIADLNRLYANVQAAGAESMSDLERGYRGGEIKALLLSVEAKAGPFEVRNDR